MDIILMYFGSTKENGSFYSSVFSMDIKVFGLDGARHTKQTKKASEVHTVWLNDLEHQLSEEEIPATAYLVPDLGLFKTRKEAEKASSK